MTTTIDKRTTTPLRHSLNLEHTSEDGLLAPLSSNMRRQIYELKAAYEDFWQQRKFRKGWAKPLFAFDEEVEELLAQAAEVVVRIRAHFDTVAPAPPRGLAKSTSAIPTRMPRLRQGRAREYLCALEEDPRAAPQQFVREIVRATLSSEDGFLEEGLTSEKLDDFTNKILAHFKLRDEDQARAAVQLEDKLLRRWAKAEKLLQQFHGLSTEEKTSKSHYHSLHKILRRVDDIREELKLMLKRTEAERSTTSEPGQEVTSDSPASENDIQVGDQCKEPSEEAQPTDHKVEVAAQQIPEGELETEQLSQEEQEAEEPRKDEQKEAAENEAEGAEQEETKEKETDEADETEQSKEQVMEKNEVMEKEREDKPAETSEAKDEEQNEKASVAKSAPEATEGEDAVADETAEEREEDLESEETKRQKAIEKEREKAMLKIKNVADSVNRLSDQIEGFTHETTGLNLEDLQKEPESAEKTLAKLQKQCLYYSENLMKDLLSLDAISTGTLPGTEGASDDVRPLRKQQVKEIQNLLQDVDQVNSKLKAMLKQIKEEKQRREETRKKAQMDEQAKQTDVEEEGEEEGDAENRSAEEEEFAKPDGGIAPAKRAPSPSGDDLWRTMKLKPKFEMAQTGDAVVLQAHIPGMREEDIKIEADGSGRAFTVKGLRVPTPAEEAAMRRQLQSVLARDPWGLYYPRGEKERDLLMRMAAGRYGSFSETFQVSNEMDLSAITASYKGGVLRIVVPISPRKGTVPQYQHRAPQRRRHRQQQQPPQYGYNYPGAGFFNDKAFWW